MMGKNVKIALNILSIVAVLGLMAFQSISSSAIKVSSLEISIENADEQFFIYKDEIKSFILSLQDSLYEESLKEINISMLEDTLKTMTYVANAEVFSTLDGKLSVLLKQNNAIARIKDGEYWFYIDHEGDKMPLSRHYSAMVPLITGNVNDKSLDYICQLLLKSTTDPFFEGYIQGINVENDKSLTIYPSFGKHKVLWGSQMMTDNKLNKLKAFYSHFESEEKIAGIKTINVQYEGQVVYTNY